MSGSGEILIVGNCREESCIAENILREEGYSVHTASSGKYALSFLEKELPDLIMLDIKISDMNGFELCKIIKSDDMTCHIPVMLFSSDNSSDTIRKCFEAGCCDYIVKPFIKDEFLAKAKAHIDIAQKTKALESANSELKMFTSAVSHDLRSPLSVIKMLIDTLEDELENDSRDDVIKIISMLKSKSVQTLEMTEHLLEFSKVCNAVPNVEDIDLNLLIDDIYSELITLEADRRIILKTEPLPSVSGDIVLIRMLFQNLLSNAIKFTQNRETAEIRVSAADSADYIIITVKDNGTGFDMRYYDRLFKIFHRLHSDEFKGSGVGLALCDRIIRRHGGKIEAISAPDKGAEFKTYFRKNSRVKQAGLL